MAGCLTQLTEIKITSSNLFFFPQLSEVPRGMSEFSFSQAKIVIFIHI